MQAQTPYLTVNPFEQLCFLASDEEWCWKLGCTTCGHAHFRYSFAELATGKAPADKDWLIHRRRTRYKNQLGPFPKQYSDEQEVRVLEICSRADISRIAERCKFPDWLGYLGLILEHMKSNHDSYRIVSSLWAQQLRDLSPPKSLIYARLNEIEANVAEFLTIEDLEQFESNIRLGTLVLPREYHPGLDSPEARANFATRHIFKLTERKRRRDELLKKFRAEKVVDMYPGDKHEKPKNRE